MKCVMCKHGTIQPGKVTVTLHRDETVVVIKEVPADVCQQCGEYYLDQVTTVRIMAMAEEAVKHNVEVEVLRYAA
jgi:YgiT-type zinc finger domain-containing protein